MAAGGIFQLTGLISVQGLTDLTGDLAKATAAGNLFADALKAAFSIAEKGADAFLRTFTDVIEKSIQEAVKIEKIKQTFAGIYGGDEGLADKKVAKIRDYARSSLNNADTLLEVGTIAEMGGLNFTGRMMKDIDVLSRGNAERARQITEAVVRALAGGNPARALQRVGIGYDDLRASGVKISAGHHIESSGIDTVNGIFDAAERKFPKLGETLAKSVQVKFTDMQDSWLQLLDKFGQAWFPLIGKIIDSLAPFINFLTDSGEMEKLGKAFSAAFSLVFADSGGRQGLEAFLAYMIASFELLPDIITNVGKTVATVFHAIVQEATNELKQFIPFFIGIANVIRGLMVNMANLDKFFGVESAADKNIIANMSSPLKVPEFKDLPDLFGQILSALGGKNAPSGALAARQKEILASLDNYKKTPKGILDDPGGGKTTNQVHLDEVATASKQTAVNTAKIAAHMEPFKRFALGGGPIGQIGISMAERYNSQTHRVQVDVRSGNVHLDRFLGEAIEQYHQSFRRSAL